MTKKDRKNRDIETPEPQITTPEPEIETTDPDVAALRPQIEAPRPVIDERNGRPVVEWLGPAIPVACPKCTARILQDRYTKACVVTSTREIQEGPGGKYRDRDMKCQACGAPFVARELIV